MKIFGIDPGIKGGAAVYDTQTEVLDFCKFESPIIMYSWLRSHLPTGTGGTAILEAVSSMPHDGHVGAFTFGKNVGQYQGMLLSLGCFVTEVAPPVWQGMLGCLTGGDKGVTKRKAQSLFPDIKVTHAIADALLLMTYGAKMLGRPISTTYKRALNSYT